MTRILLVRHGKASDDFDNYDVLSARGAAQSARLAARLLADGEAPALAAHGALARQRDTARAVADAFARAGRPFPALAEDPRLDEIPMRVVQAAVARMSDPDQQARVARWVGEHAGQEPPPDP